MEPSRGRFSPARTRPRGVAASATAALLALLAPVPAQPQSSLGTIRGSLSDDQGDPMSGAAVRVVDEATAIQRETQTSAAGDYEVPNLRAGSYRVEDASGGFSAFQRTGVVLSAGDTVRVDLRLSQLILRPEGGGEARAPVPLRAEELVVTGEGGSNIQLESPAIQISLDHQQLTTLPRNSLEPQDYLYLTANVVGQERGGQFLSGRSYGVYVLQDGQPSNGLGSGVLARSVSGLQAIDELKVLSNAYGAEHGGLATIVVTTRRGGSQLGGGAFYDFNADELNALTYDLKLGGVERGSAGTNTSDHRYGAWLSGPLRKQKTFFFVNYQGFRRSFIDGGQLASVPTERMRRGDFSELLPETVILDPATRQPFPGNVIPPQRIDPAAQRILDFYYQPPNLPPSRATRLGTYRDFVNLNSNNNRLDLRLDNDFSASDSVFVRFSWLDGKPGNFLLEDALPRLGTQQRNVRSRILATSWVRIFSSRLLNEVRGGWNLRTNRVSNPYVVGQVASERLGIEVPADVRQYGGYPSLAFLSDTRPVTGISDPSLQERQTDEATVSFSDTLTWLLGRHSLKLGGLYSRDHFVSSAPLGFVGLTGRLIFDDAAGFTGNAVADLLLGLPRRSVEGIGNRRDQPLDVTSQVVAAFVQDDWKVSSRLTLFMGLRYEVETGFQERRGLLANLDPEAGRIVVPDASVAPLVTLESLPIVTASEVGLGPTLVNPDTNNLAPRLGFAYRLDENKTVLRGGAGLFYPTSTAEGVQELLSRSAFQATRLRVRPALARAFSTGEVSVRSTDVVNAIDVDLETPEFLQYHLTLERELPGDFGFRVSYLGAHAEKLLVARRFNTLPASLTPFDPRRLPFPTLSTSILKLENTGSGSFKALQLEATRRFRSGFGMHAAYTLSRTRSDAPDASNSTRGVIQFDPYDLAKDLGPDPYVPRHRFVMDATCELPFGRRRAHSGLPGWLNALVGDWTVSTVLQARSGPFLTPFYVGADRANTGIVGEARGHPDLVGDATGPGERDNFFNLGAFRLPAPGTLGDVPAGVIEGPGSWVINVGLYKQIVSGPRFVLEARATLDNAFNHPQFFVDPSFVNLTDYLVHGLPVTESNDSTNVLRTVTNLDRFAPGRVIRLGLQLRF